MKKKNIAYKKHVSGMQALFLSVFIIVVFIAIYLSFFPSNVKLSPDETDEAAMPFPDAGSLLAKLGQEGIDWYCGERESYIDVAGNVYGQEELGELKRILGNEKMLRQKFC